MFHIRSCARMAASSVTAIPVPLKEEHVPTCRARGPDVVPSQEWFLGEAFDPSTRPQRAAEKLQVHSRSLLGGNLDYSPTPGFSRDGHRFRFVLSGDLRPRFRRESAKPFGPRVWDRSETTRVLRPHRSTAAEVVVDVTGRGFFGAQRFFETAMLMEGEIKWVLRNPSNRSKYTLD